jgi:anti-anti-sigma factor
MPRRKRDFEREHLSFEIERDNSTLTVKLSGEADLYGSTYLKQGLARKLGRVRKIVFDLEGLDFADSYFLRVLIGLRKRLGGVSSVKVINAKSHVNRIFVITGLDELFM